MADMDRRTGEVIDNLTSAFQSVEIILSTRIGSLVTLREFGGGAVDLLGRALTARLFAVFCQLIGTAIDLWEPRFRVRQVFGTGSVEQIRMGTAGIEIEVDYMPRGHLGDFTVERVVQLNVGFFGGVSVQ